MLKILVGCAFACLISTNATLAAADVMTPKVTGASLEKVANLQKVNFTALKNDYSQLGKVNTPARDKVANPESNAKATPQNAQIGLLLTGLMCFVARASRRKV